MARHLVLTGFMGAGKSSSATHLAKQLGRISLDSDALLEADLGMPIADFFAKNGESEFRRREAELVAKLLDSEDPAVIALGGGALAQESTLDALLPHLVAYLEVDVSTAWLRVKNSSRPLAADERKFRELYDQRQSTYEDSADAIIPNNPRGALREALPMLRELLDRKSGPRVLFSSGKSWSYPAVFDPGVLERGDIWLGRRDHVTVTDENLAKLFPWLADGIVVPAGESAKTFSEVERVCSSLAQRHFERGRQLVAVGGGVVGDLAGFSAAVYQRGTPFLQVPTSLVAQVDSAYGGKTGVDLPTAKNYAGAYHQPDGVLVDTDVLGRLPRAELVAGYAEVIKTALIAGGRLWQRISQPVDLDQPLDPWVVFECARTKLDVVAADERDADVRQILNLGHTVGHAIETAAGYGNLRHGEAVSIGLAAAMRLSGDDSLRRQVVDICEAAGLPVTVSGLSVDAVIDGVKLDKKRKGDDVPFVLVESPGNVTPGHTVDAGDLRAAVEEVIV